MDRHVCPICAPLDGLVADFNAGWQHPGGTVADGDSTIDVSRYAGRTLQHPAHPGCRCFGRPIVDDGTSLDDAEEIPMMRFDRRAYFETEAA
jgi:hypothetical protein